MSDISKAIQELLPCPFCGGEATITKHFKDDLWRLTHRCKTMGFIEIDWRMSPEWLAKQWNTRALESAVEGGTVDYGTPCLPPQSQAEREAHILLNIIVNRLEEPSNLRCYISRNMAWGLISFDTLTLMAEALGRWENDGPDNPDGGWILPESACKPSPTPDLTARIEAAAEEIEGVIEKVIKNGFNQYEKQSGIFIPITIKWDREKFAAILRRNLEGGG